MVCLRRPTRAEIDAELVRCGRGPFSYTPVGGTTGGTPPGYHPLRHAAAVGSGDAAFQAAVAAIERWAMFDLGWVSLCWPEAPIAVGQVVGALARCGGLYWLNPCRIVYVVDEPDERRRGFAYGTLSGHAERGEELFEVRHDPDDVVWFSISSFSRPAHPLAVLALPWVRRLQRRFAAQGVAAVARAVAASGALP